MSAADSSRERIKMPDANDSDVGFILKMPSLDLDDWFAIFIVALIAVSAYFAFIAPNAREHCQAEAMLRGAYNETMDSRYIDGRCLVRLDGKWVEVQP